MKRASFTEVRNQAKRYSEMVESSETVRALRNGKPVADINAPRPPAPPIEF